MSTPTWDQQRLIRGTAIKVARSYLSRHRFGSEDRDAVLSDAMFGVWKAWRSFDPDRGASFHTYAWIRGMGAILDGVRRRGVLSRAEVTAKVTHDDLPVWRKMPYSLEYLRELRAATDADPVDYFATIEGLIYVEQLLELLPEPQAQALRLRYVHQWTLREVGVDLGMTESGAHHLIRRGVKRLREHLEGETA